jgi:immune inhibitor A
VKSAKKVYRFWKSGAPSGEYFLAEHRRQAGYDKKLPGEGLLIYHIDESIEENSDENHPKVRLMEADNQNHLHDGANRGDDGDPYPGRSSNHTFDKASSPGSKAYSGADSCVSLTSIQRVGANIKTTTKVTCPTPSSPRKRKGAAKKAGKGRRR